MRAPSAARANATARPCPCAAPVIKATLPSNSPAEFIKIFVELDFQNVVNDVRGDHETGERGERHDLLGIEETRQLLVERSWHSIALLRCGASECDQHLPLFVQLQLIRIFAPLN